MKAGMAVGAAVLMGVFLHGQAAPAPKNEDVLPALLAEVRGLRAAMEQMASAGPRIQLFVSRLQLQETRMNTMIRRLDTVRENLAIGQRELGNAQESQQAVEKQLAAGTYPPGRADELTEIVAHLKREATDRKATVARLTTEEGQIAQDLAAEQARWSEINQRLDELERALSKR
jgi:outer membrane murein-binding lipoprotein Lpp